MISSYPLRKENSFASNSSTACAAEQCAYCSGDNHETCCINRELFSPTRSNENLFVNGALWNQPPCMSIPNEGSRRNTTSNPSSPALVSLVTHATSTTELATPQEILRCIRDLALLNMIEKAKGQLSNGLASRLVRDDGTFYHCTFVPLHVPFGCPLLPMV